MSLKVMKKIFDARNVIKESSLKKAGRNNHSNYDYYTPEQVSHLVHEACVKLNLLNTYNLKRTELGLVAELTVTDLDSGEEKTFSLATDIPQITATNIAQQLGGAVTYSERYLLMSIYDIKDNNLDFDAQQPEKKTESKKSEPKKKVIERSLTQKEVSDKWNGKIYKGDIVYIDESAIKPPHEQVEKLKKHDNYKEK